MLFVIYVLIKLLNHFNLYIVYRYVFDNISKLKICITIKLTDYKIFLIIKYI